jgi:molecular chaperone GrpE
MSNSYYSEYNNEPDDKDGVDIHPAVIVEDDEYEEGNGRVAIDLDSSLEMDDLEAIFNPQISSSRKKAAAAAYATNSTPGAVIDEGGDVVEGAEAPVAAGLDPAREAELKAEIDTAKNNHLRAVADLHNYRKRTDEEIKRIKANANERLIKDILPLMDDFNNGLNAAKSAQSYEQLVGGVEAVLRKFNDLLAKEGIEAIPAVGEQFNPDVHEAVVVEEGSDAPDESVTEELRKGYTLHGRVIRPSLVKVAKN